MEQEIHSLINATFAPRPVRCTYHVARSEVCLLHKPHKINIPSRPRLSNGLILAILPGKHAPHTLRARFWSTSALPGRCCAILAGSFHPPCLGRQLGRARTEQQRGGEDVRSGRLLPGDQHTGRARTHDVTDSGSQKVKHFFSGFKHL